MAAAGQRLSASLFAARSPSRTIFSQLFSQPFLPTLSISVPAIHLNLPSTISEIWDSVLRAVPKKKTSYSKKRSRQLAGKALKDVTGLNRCSACGGLKKSHVLCPYCVKGIQDMWKGKSQERGEEKIEDS
ncbi:MAG: Cell death protease [Chaenotheca gracillima]|nr:MAG: Cell death protease [Chaenotheca gracillima]